jgi:hypothetical protein
MSSRPFRPLGLPIYVARVPAAPFSRLLLWLYLDHSHCPVLAPATVAALPSTRAIPDRDVFYVADPVSSIQGPQATRPPLFYHKDGDSKIQAAYDAWTEA